MRMASWDYATIYHELHRRSMEAVPDSGALRNLPVPRSEPGLSTNVTVGELRVYLQRMKGLLEQDET